MRDLRLIGVHDDGEHLVVADDAGERFRLRIDDPLRAAARRDRPRLGQLQIEIDGDVRPRDVQAMIRAGATAEEVAARTGWTPERVARFEGPVLAERDHVATRAQSVRLRGSNAAGATETLGQRAAARLSERGVDAASVVWDAARDGDGQWTVSAGFLAGGRDRLATWWFDAAGMSVVARNDEAKWLSEADTPAGPVPAQVHRPTDVFDVEASERPGQRADTDDLIASMRESSGARNRRRRGGRRRGAARAGAESLPLDEAEGLPPSAKGPHPEDLARAAEEQDAQRVEPAVAVPVVASPDPAGGEAGPSEAEASDTEAPAAAAPEAADEPELLVPADEPEPTGDPVEAPSDQQAGSPAAEPSVDPSPTEEPGLAEVALEPSLTDEADAAPTGPETTQDGDAEAGATSGSEQDDSAPTADDASDGGAGETDAAGSEDSPRPAPPKKKGRARVPSWDDVMFGAKKD